MKLDQFIYKIVCSYLSLLSYIPRLFCCRIPWWLLEKDCTRPTCASGTPMRRRRCGNFFVEPYGRSVWPWKFCVKDDVFQEELALIDANLSSAVHELRCCGRETEQRHNELCQRHGPRACSLVDSMRHAHVKTDAIQFLFENQISFASSAAI